MSEQKSYKTIEYPYPRVVESSMRKMFISLSEKDRRRYAAIESLKLPHGGKQYICELLNCHIKTLNKGVEELKRDNLDDA